jgi:hypothetical protein
MLPSKVITVGNTKNLVDKFTVYFVKSKNIPRMGRRHDLLARARYVRDCLFPRTGHRQRTLLTLSCEFTKLKLKFISIRRM